jgi:endonuclease/exonuclease/phosphatase (EEP) superfamily protein YafD
VTQRGALVSSHPAGRLRIVSANLWNGAAAADTFAALVAALGADVVATQEMAPEQADALARVLPHGVLEPARDCSGMGIALRNPARVRRLGLPFRDAWVADVLWEGPAGMHLELEILNVHVHAPHAPLGWRMLSRRRGQLRELVHHLEASPQRRRVLVGDFNATPLWPLYRRLAARLTDAAVAAARRHGRSVEGTWAPWPGGPRLLRIDHAFVHGVAVEDFQVLPIAGSDHCAIVVDIAAPVAALTAPERTRPAVYPDDVARADAERSHPV